MKDVTQLVNTYRECVRNLWNIYFRPQVSAHNKWILSDEFDNVCTLLFSSLVLQPLNCTSYTKSRSYEQFPQPLLFLRVIPSAETGVPININQQVQSSGYWDYQLAVIKPEDADMRFIDLFDFDMLGFRDFQYCRVRIIGSDTYPDIIGRDALLDSNHVRVIFNESIELERHGSPSE